MITGVQIESFIYPADESRPANGAWMLSGGIIEFGSSQSVRHTKSDGIPVPGKSYSVEYVLTVFETDIPPQHMWSPLGKNYKVLWQQTLKGIVEAGSQITSEIWLH